MGTVPRGKCPTTRRQPPPPSLHILPAHRVPPRPCCPPRASDEVVRAVPRLAQAAALAPRRREAAHLAVLVDGVHNPVDAGVPADGVVRGVHQDDLIVLVGGVLVDPVRVQHAQVGAAAADALLRHGAQVAHGRDEDALVLGLAVHDALGDGLLAAATAHGDAVDHEALLGLVSQAARLVGAGGVRAARDLVLLAVLPGADAQQEAEHCEAQGGREGGGGGARNKGGAGGGARTTNGGLSTRAHTRRSRIKAMRGELLHASRSLCREH